MRHTLISLADLSAYSVLFHFSNNKCETCQIPQLAVWGLLFAKTRCGVRAKSTNIGSVWAQLAFPLHASEITDKSEKGRKKYFSVSAESSHFFPFKKGLHRRGLKFDVLRRGCDKKRHKLKKNNFCTRSSHSSQKCDKCNAWHFLSSKKWQMWRDSTKSESGTWEEIGLRPALW